MNPERYEDAIYCYDIVVSLNSHLANTYYNKGGALANIERYEEAINAMTM
ncbi:MAG: hypothetical protein ACXWE6_11220 [Nitrososphaeraceae archaeon]